MMDKNEMAYLGWILDQHKEKDFVQRILRPSESPTLDLGDGNYATHKMATSQYGGKHYAYPTVQRDPRGSGLVDKGKNAFLDALNSGEVIPFDTPGDAEWFSKNYKKVWEMK
jgi:hypothetical protein